MYIYIYIYLITAGMYILKNLDTIGAEYPKAQAESQEFMSKFLNMYKNSGLALSSPLAKNGNVSRDDNISGGSDKSWSLFGWSFGRNSKETRELDTENTKSPAEECSFTIPRDPFLSPYLASDNMLAHLPPTKLLVPVRISLKLILLLILQYKMQYVVNIIKIKNIIWILLTLNHILFL